MESTNNTNIEEIGTFNKVGSADHYKAELRKLKKTFSDIVFGIFPEGVPDARTFRIKELLARAINSRIPTNGAGFLFHVILPKDISPISGFSDKDKESLKADLSWIEEKWYNSFEDTLNQLILEKGVSGLASEDSCSTLPTAIMQTSEFPMCPITGYLINFFQNFNYIYEFKIDEDDQIESVINAWDQCYIWIQGVSKLFHPIEEMINSVKILHFDFRISDYLTNLFKRSNYELIKEKLLDTIVETINQCRDDLKGERKRIIGEKTKRPKDSFDTVAQMAFYSEVILPEIKKTSKNYQKITRLFNFLLDMNLNRSTVFFYQHSGFSYLEDTVKICIVLF